MRGKLVLVMVLLILVFGMLGVVLRVQRVEASETIYIRADGIVDPPTAPIQRDGDLYTLSGNITSDTDGIVIQRDNMTLDGAGYTIQGTGYPSIGINLTRRNNVTIKNARVNAFYFNIYLHESSDNTICENNMMDESGIWFCNSSNNRVYRNYIYNGTIGLDSGSNYNVIYENQLEEAWYCGIGLGSASYNVIYGNRITGGFWGVEVEGGSQNIICGNNITECQQYGVHIATCDNKFYHNNFMNNTQNVRIHAPGFPGYANLWDNGHASGGNYWSNYTGVDEFNGPNQDQPGSDGIGDVPYVIDAYNQDSYPLVNPRASPPDYPLSEWIESPNYSSADQRNITHIVIHVMDGTMEGSINWFKNPDSNVSAHYLISQEGKIVQMVMEKNTAWHAGNWDYNQHSIGIEHEDKGNWNEPNWETAELYEASAALARSLCEKYGIPKNRNYIIGHNEVPGVTKPCPGPYWDWEYFMSLVEGTTPVRRFYASWETAQYPVIILSNSTVRNFNFSQPEARISFNVTGFSGIQGFCNITIPKILLTDNPWNITINGNPITNFSQTDNTTHSFLYFTYTYGSTLQVVIQGTSVIPEFPSFLILPLFMITTLLAVIVYRRKRQYE